jgi:GAF domain-containing protein
MSLFKRLATTDASIAVSGLLVATADSSDALIDGSVNDVLRAMRDQFGMDVVFVSEFVEGHRVFRFADSTGRGPSLRPGASDPLEETFCQRVVDGRLPGFIEDATHLRVGRDVPPTPFAVGTHLSTPIVLKDGRTYGTLCCFSTTPNPLLRESDLLLLRQSAQLVARKIELAEAHGIEEPAPEWELEPAEKYESKIWKLP